MKGWWPRSYKSGPTGAVRSQAGDTRASSLVQIDHLSLLLIPGWGGGRARCTHAQTRPQAGERAPSPWLRDGAPGSRGVPTAGTAGLPRAASAPYPPALSTAGQFPGPTCGSEARPPGGGQGRGHALARDLPPTGCPAPPARAAGSRQVSPT